MGVHHFLIETSAYLSSNDLKSNLYCRHSAWYIKCTQTREAMSISYDQFRQNLFEICQHYSLKNEKNDNGLSVNISCGGNSCKAEIILTLYNKENLKMKFTLPIFNEIYPDELIGCLKDTSNDVSESLNDTLCMIRDGWIPVLAYLISKTGWSHEISTGQAIEKFPTTHSLNWTATTSMFNKREFKIKSYQEKLGKFHFKVQFNQEEEWHIFQRGKMQTLLDSIGSKFKIQYSVRSKYEEHIHRINLLLHDLHTASSVKAKLSVSTRPSCPGENAPTRSDAGCSA